MKNRILVLTAALLFFPAIVFAAGTNTFVKTSTGTLTGAPTTYTTAITGKASINAITVHYSTASTNNVGIYIDSEEGATYDTLFATSDSVSMKDLFWQPDNELIIEKKDEISIILGGGTSTATYTITVRGDYK